MATRKIKGKVKLGLSILRDEGPTSFLIKSLEHSRKKSSHNSQGSTLVNIQTKASLYDIISADFFNNPKKWSKNNTKPPFRFLWIMPPPGKGSGGHMNIFRFIKVLENAGHQCDIVLNLEGASGTVEQVKAVMSGYPDVKATKTMRWLADFSITDKHYAGIFATSWETAYVSYNLDSEAERFYFVQDFEPYFYPVGSLYYLAENTYKFGFYGVTAGGWLAKKLHDEYAMETDNYNFGSDEKTYYLKSKRVERKGIFFYARPFTDRRGFEMGLIALGLFHKMHPDYSIMFAGWDVSEYNIPFPYKNLKTLELDELNDVYNYCAAGLILSYTNMSLLPLEIMAAGAIPVVNDAPNNRLVSDNPYIAYTNNDPISLANSLSAIVQRKDATDYSINASKSAQGESWKEAEAKFLDIITNRLVENE